jgi:hypothetical protein
MRKLLIITILFISSVSFAQFKGDDSKPVDIRGGILSQNPSGSLFSFLDFSKFSMNHSFGMSYSAFGNNGVSLGVYTNHLSYEFSENLDVQLDASIVNSPYNTLGDSFSKSINGVYIDNARINYRPSEDFNISLQFSNSPYNYYNRYNYSRSFSPFSRYWDD